MVDTIETFVAMLQSEGVQAGQEQAEKLLADAEAQAEKIRAQAQADAEKINADAQGQAQNILARAQTELQLAARDTTLKLRYDLSKVLQAVISAGAAERLADADFLGKTLHELILMYAGSDLHNSIEINVQPEMQAKLADWALHEIAKESADGSHIALDLKGTLAQAGFEYNVSGATIEVTLESVVEAIVQLVSPKLGEIVARASAQAKG